MICTAHLTVEQRPAALNNCPVTTQPRYLPPQNLTRFAWLSIGAAVVTIVLKAGAAWLTGSVGLLSDAAESLVNLVAAVVALMMLRVAIKPPDAHHPFGHSKAEYFSAAIEGVMIFVAASFIIYSAIGRIINPVMPQQLGVGLLISVLASLVNGAVSWVLFRAGRQHRSATLVADAKHLFTDVLTSAAVLLGVGLVAIFREPVMDAAVALLAGLNILWMGFRLIRDSANGLMDVALPIDEQAELEAVLERHRSPRRIDFHAVRTREAGNRRFMDVHVLVPGHWTVQQGHDYAEDLIDELISVVPDIRVNAHIEPIEDARSYADEVDF